MDIFDILGPIMVGPSSSHTAGAARIGGMARSLLGAAPVKAQIHLHGSFAETGAGHGTDRALVGGLLGMDPGIAAALGMVGLFCSGTNATLASIILSIELFGTANLYLFAGMCVVSCLLAGQSSLYGSQISKYDNTSMKRVAPRFR